MNIEHIRKRISNGFRPFAIRTSDGRKIVVPNPDAVAISKNVVVVISSNEMVDIIDPLHIVALEEKLARR
jgi:hypothetical protein